MNDKGNIATVEEYLKLSVSDRKAALDENRFQIPTKKSNPVEREKWDRLYQKTLVEPENSAPETVADSTEKPVEKKPDAAPSAPEKVADGAAPGSAPEKVADRRFKTLEEAEKAYEEKEKLINSQQDIINKLNSTSSSNGRQVKELQKQLATVQEKIKNLPEPAPKAEELDLPDPPEPPDPEKFEEDGGVNSEDYQKARAKYDKEQVAYLKKIKPLFKSVSDVRKENEELKAEVQDFKRFKDASLTRDAEDVAKQSASEVDTATDELQKDFALTTTVPWRSINDQLRTANDATADPAVRELSKKFIDGLSKLAKAVGFAFDFSSPVPKKIMDIKSNRFRGTLLDEGFEFAKQPPSQSNIDLEALRLKQASQNSSGIPPSAMGADENLRSANTIAEKKKRLTELQDIWTSQQANNDYTGFRKGPFYKEYMALKMELGG